MAPAPRNYVFASDNTAGICPEALAALNAANAGRVPSYGDDEWTARARARLREVFETECEVFFVFNGTAANALALSAACRSFQSIVCHQHSHLETDECNAPEFFTGGAKVLPLPGDGAKLDPAAVEAVTHRGHGVHYAKPGALSLTQATELGTVYTPAEIRALGAVAKKHGLVMHLDGARFANALVTLRERLGATPADLTWRAGVDVLSFGGTKNGMHTTEVVVCFNRDLGRDFDRRVKQSGQLASKQRFAAAQWAAVLADGAWLRHAAHANAMARRLAQGLQSLPGCRLPWPTEANGVFVTLPPALAAGLDTQGWQFYRFFGDDGYRFMCSWDTQPAEVDVFVAAARDLASRK
ncbi:MAG: threonine aldolase family protein [Opitutales bacterium]